MKTPYTLPGNPTDIVARWAVIEELVSGELEAEVAEIVRHVALGCSRCKHEEVIRLLTAWPRQLCTLREAVMLLDVLAVQYVTSARGRAEFAALFRGEQPVLHVPEAIANYSVSPFSRESF